MHLISVPNIAMDSLENIIAIYKKIQEAKDQKISLDVSSCSIFQADLCAVLGAMLFDSDKQGYYGRIEPGDNHVYSSLEKNGFVQALNNPKKSSVDQANLDNNIIPYQCFNTSRKDREEFNQYLDKYFWGQKEFPDLSEELKQDIKKALFEIWENIEMHSGQHFAFVCGQHYPKEQALNLTIANCGKTIVENVREFKKEDKLPSVPAIEWALETGNTTRALSNNNTSGGLGLAIIQDFIMVNEGEFSMCSDDVKYSYVQKKKTSHQFSDRFQGTFFHLSINMDKDSTYSKHHEAAESDVNFDPADL